MKASELRIGNYLINNINGEILIPCDVLCDGINTDKYEGLNYGFIDPIPLTEEWLLKFGFEWKGNKFLTIFTPYGKALAYVEDNFFKFIGVTIEIQIKYVHQLQNLYFALTGEELTFKSE